MSNDDNEGSLGGSPPGPGQSTWSGGLPWSQGQGIWQKEGRAANGEKSRSAAALGSDDVESHSRDQTSPGSMARQQRSLSFSLGTFRPDDESGRVSTELLNDVGSRSMNSMRTSQGDSAYPYGVRNRNRSQSSSAGFGVDEGYDVETSPDWAEDSKRSPEGMRPPPASGQAPSHRRSLSMTQGNDAWEKEYPPTTIPLASGDDDTPKGVRLQRRFSHSPQLYFDHAAMPNRPGGDDDEAANMEGGRRRHSVGAPVLYGEQAQDSLVDSFGSMRVDEGGMMRGMPGASSGYPVYDPQTGYLMQPMYAEDINDYFENQEHRARAWVEGARNLQMQQFTQRWPLYVVEFKAGRKDFFFIPENSNFIPKKGDFVVVEADRGKDLGKVVNDSIRSQQELQAYQQMHAANFLDNQAGKEVHAKRIFRLAQSAELAMLSAKMGDEEKAMNICQGKVRSKRLPMEVVDAEYQWDRRKLTFYFVADRRIDFRELVRDLFKIYKTRIWLCSCGGQVGRDGGSDDGMPGSPPRSVRSEFSGSGGDYGRSSSGRDLDFGGGSSSMSMSSQSSNFGPGTMSPSMGGMGPQGMPMAPPYPVMGAFRPMALAPPPMAGGYGAQPPMPYGMRDMGPPQHMMAPRIHPGMDSRR